MTNRIYSIKMDLFKHHMNFEGGERNEKVRQIRNNEKGMEVLQNITPTVIQWLCVFRESVRGASLYARIRRAKRRERDFREGWGRR